MRAEALKTGSVPAADAQERHERLASAHLKSLMQVFEAPLAQLQTDAARQQPLRFFCDLCGGYHVGLRADLADLRFAPGLVERLASHQIQRRARGVVSLLVASEEVPAPAHPATFGTCALRPVFAALPLDDAETPA